MDLKIALRRLARNPAFFATACLSLALGIGANTAAFSVVYAVLLRSLPVRDPASLAVVSTKYTGFRYSMSHPAYAYLRDHSSSLDGLVAFRAQPVNFSAGGTTERVTGMLVSGNYFDVLGIGMATGSPIQPEDDRVPVSGGARGLVAVLSHQHWQRRFNGSAAVVGTSVRINGHPFTIVGVAPPGFHGTRVGSLPDVFMPMMFAAQLFEMPNWLSNPGNNWLRIIARVKPATSLAQAQAEMTVVFRRFNQEVILPLANTDTARRRAREGLIVLEPGQTGLLEMGNTIRPTLFALMGLVTLVLIIDEVSAPGPVIVNENFVKTYLPPGQDPVGASIVGNGNMTFRIIGVVKDSASTGLRDLDQHMLYVPGGRGVLHVRSAVPPASLTASIQAAVHRLDPDLPVFNVRTIDEQIDRSMRTERTFAMLSSTFGVLALVLSAVGLYGVIANAVSRRRKELGVRLALGAEPRQILRLVLGDAGRLVALGAVAGLPCALLTGRAIRSLLFGVQPGDWKSVAAALGVLMMVAGFSAWVPARRASRADPMVALRSA